METSDFFPWTSTRILSLNLYLMNINRNASMKTINPSTLSLSVFFFSKIDPFLVSEH